MSLDKINIGNLDDWQPGQPLRADKLQQPVSTLKSLGAPAPPGQSSEERVARYQEKLFKVVRLEKDVIICHTFDGVTEGTDEIKVALPYLMRQTPFDGTPARDGITYVYSREDKRTATDEDDEEEEQIFVANYVEGDLIMGKKGIFGGTGLYADDPVNSIPIVWVDTNNDGRFWALDDDPDES